MTSHDRAARRSHRSGLDHDDAEVDVGRTTFTASLDRPGPHRPSGLILRQHDTMGAIGVAAAVEGTASADHSRDENGVAAGAESAVDLAAGSSGAALPHELKDRFESSLDTDLSSVRIHTGAESAAAADAVGARAYAVGQDIHFGAGQYDPTSGAGVHLIAHEVAHTVQQRGEEPSRQNKLEVSTPADAAEREADRAADAMLDGRAAEISSSPPDTLPRRLMRDANAHASPPGLGVSTPPDMSPTNWKALVSPIPGPPEPEPSHQIPIPARAPLPPGVTHDARDVTMQSPQCAPSKDEPSVFARKEPQYSWETFQRRSDSWAEYKGTASTVCTVLGQAAPPIHAYNNAEDDPSLKSVYEWQTKGKVGSVADVANRQVVPRTSQSGVTVGATFKAGTNTANTDGLEDNIKRAGKSEAVEGAISALKGKDAALESKNSAAEAAASSLSSACHTLQASGFAVRMDEAEQDKEAGEKEKGEVEAKAAAVKNIIGKVASGVAFIAGVAAGGPAAAAGGVIAMAGEGGQNLQLGTYTPNAAPPPTAGASAAGAIKSAASSSIVTTIAGKIVDWYYQEALDAADEKISAAVASYRAARKGKATEEWLAASDNVAAQLANLKSAMSAIKAALLERKGAYQALASAMATAGGGSQHEQDRMKALILAIPVAKAVQAKASNVLNYLGEPADSPGTQVAFTMAVHAGQDHPWQLVAKTGTIAGYRQQFQGYLDQWTERVNSLEAVIGQVDSIIDAGK